MRTWKPDNYLLPNIPRRFMKPSQRSFAAAAALTNPLIRCTSTPLGTFVGQRERKRKGWKGRGKEEEEEEMYHGRGGGGAKERAKAATPLGENSVFSPTLEVAKSTDQYRVERAFLHISEGKKCFCFSRRNLSSNVRLSGFACLLLLRILHGAGRRREMGVVGWNSVRCPV